MCPGERQTTNILEESIMDTRRDACEGIVKDIDGAALHCYGKRTFLFLALPENLSGRKESPLDTKPITANKRWMRIPNGTKVRLLEGGQEGVIDGLTELVVGPGRNPDGRTQYRLNVGDQARILAVEDALVVLTDGDGLVLIAKENIAYRRIVTDQLRADLPTERFVASA